MPHRKRSGDVRARNSNNGANSKGAASHQGKRKVVVKGGDLKYPAHVNKYHPGGSKAPAVSSHEPSTLSSYHSSGNLLGSSFGRSSFYSSSFGSPLSYNERPQNDPSLPSDLKAHEKAVRSYTSIYRQAVEV